MKDFVRPSRSRPARGLRAWVSARVQAAFLHREGNMTMPEIEQTFGTLQMTKGKIQYWKKKLEDNDDEPFHRKSWGGARNFLYEPFEAVLIRALIWWRVNAEAKTASILACAQAANDGMVALGRPLEPPVSKSYVKSVFCEWRWSFQVPLEVQRFKFTPDNIDHYFHYVMTIAGISFDRLHFLDEFHIVSR